MRSVFLSHDQQKQHKTINEHNSAHVIIIISSSSSRFVERIMRRL